MGNLSLTKQFETFFKKNWIKLFRLLFGEVDEIQRC